VLARLGVDTRTGLSDAEVDARITTYGPNEVPTAKSNRIRQFLKKFWGLSAWMLELIIAVSWLLHRTADLIVGLSLLLVNALLSFVQERHASDAVKALRSRLQVTSRVLRNGTWRAVGARELVPGDVVRVRMGDLVPADVRLTDGALRIDQSSLTGESREVPREPEDLLYAGSIVRQGEATGVVVATGARTYFGRTTHLVESAHPKLHVEGVVSRVVKWLFVIVGLQVGLALVASLLEGLHLLEILPLLLVLLMSAVPVALPVMFTVSMAVGSIELGRRGVLITRLNAAEDAANMDMLCADKTGTLTMNKLSLAGALPEPGFTENDVVRFAALASNEADQDPIDLAFLQAARDRRVLDGSEKQLSFAPFSPQTRRTEALVNIAGDKARVLKGALRSIGEAAGLERSAIDALEARAASEAQKGFRSIAVASAGAGAPLKLAGIAFLYDAPRPDSKRLIEKLRSLGVQVKMLTGDALAVAREMARELNLGEVVRAPDLQIARGQSDGSARELVRTSGGFAEVFPEDKFTVVKSLQSSGHVVGMTGDGVNDAPALRQAEVGIAVSGATDVAKGAASVVLTKPGLESIVDLVRNGRAIYQRVLTWIVNKVSRTILKSGFVVIAYLITGRFVISALGMMLVTFLTDFVKIALSTDRVRPSPQPETWNIGPLVKVAVILGLLMLVEALGLLVFGWHWFGLGADRGRLHTFSFQVLLFFALFSIVSIRERRMFWSSRPSWLLIVGLVAEACVGALIGARGFAEMRPLSAYETATIVGYALGCCLLINDSIKSGLILQISASRAGSVPQSQK
jgi:plasma-membrane proton-efflux P-type ATPase